MAHGAAADPSRRPSEMHRYAWEFMAFDDQEVGVPVPHNSAHVCLRSLVDPGPFADRRSDRPRSRLESRQDEDVGADAPRAPTWKDTNAPVQARGYNKSSACMCAEKLRDERRCVTGTRVRACVRASTEITRNLRRDLPRDRSLACVADRLDLIQTLWQRYPVSLIFPDVLRIAYHYVYFQSVSIEITSLL